MDGGLEALVGSAFVAFRNEIELFTQISILHPQCTVFREELRRSGGPVVIVLATGSEFAGSNPAGVDGYFQSVKILIMTSFGREIKPWVPCRRYTARKRTLSRN